MRINIKELVNCSLCDNYINESCESGNSEIESHFRLFGEQFAQSCELFRNKREPINREIDNCRALSFITSNKSEFILISGKTGKELRYKMEKKSDDIFWLTAETSGGEMVYAGVVYFDSNDYKYKFGRGVRGHLSVNDISVKSIIYLMNNLYNGNYSVNIKVVSL